MTENVNGFMNPDGEVGSADIVFNPEKDFYRGIKGELRFKAEGLFKKAKEKGISIEDIGISVIKENEVEFPGLGRVELPSFFVKVKGKDISSGQVMSDGKLIDYYNIYLKYVSEKIEEKNLIRDEQGRIVKDSDGKIRVRPDIDFMLTDWEKFDIGRRLVDDKEFGLEKTITGACDRVIRKLMGENDWLYPEEARLLDEEFNRVQKRIAEEKDDRRQVASASIRKATERQINYLKARIKNFGLDPDNKLVINEILRQLGFENTDIGSLSTIDVSRIIDNIGSVVQRVKNIITAEGHTAMAEGQAQYPAQGEGMRQ